MTELAVERQCNLAYEWWTGICSALVFSTLKRHGQDTIVELERRSVSRHQSTHFLQGIRKLGLENEPNDVLRCAKYHYFSNTLGALPMHYVEESPTKAWIRYLAPFWMGDSPLHPASGPAVLGAAFGRAPYLGWHANNGMYLGNDRLIFVQTQSLVDGDPWDGGYFTLHDRPVAPGSGYLRRVGEWGPAFDAAVAPALPHATWPPERRAKARRSYIIDFTASRCATLLEMAGEEETARIMQDAVRFVLLQRLPRLLEQVGVTTVDDLEGASALFAAVAALSGDTAQVRQEGRRRVVHCGTNRFWKTIDAYVHGVDQAWADAWTQVLGLRSPHIVCCAENAGGPDGVNWVFEERHDN